VSELAALHLGNRTTGQTVGDALQGKLTLAQTGVEYAIIGRSNGVAFVLGQYFRPRAQRWPDLL
jgi:hypothetical protein